MTEIHGRLPTHHFPPSEEYVAKFYLNEPGQAEVRSCAINAGEVAICALALAEVHAVFHRKLREGFLTADEAAIFLHGV